MKMEKMDTRGATMNTGIALRILRFRNWVRLERIRSRPYRPDEVPGISFPTGV